MLEVPDNPSFKERGEKYIIGTLDTNIEKNYGWGGKSASFRWGKISPEVDSYIQPVRMGDCHICSF